MTWYILDEFPQDRPLAERCIRCKATELTVSVDGRRDRLIREHVDFPVQIGDEFVTYDTPLDHCESCIRELAAELGLITPEKADELRQKNRKLGAENKALRTENETYRSAAEAFRAVAV